MSGHGFDDHFVLAHWVELLAASLLLLGFFVALIIQSPFLSYIVIFLAGLLAGRVLYEKYRTQPIFPSILIICGGLLGFMLGAVMANKKIIAILFFGGLWLSYKAHQKGYIGFFRSASFIR